MLLGAGGVEFGGAKFGARRAQLGRQRRLLLRRQQVRVLARRAPPSVRAAAEEGGADAPLRLDTHRSHSCHALHPLAPAPTQSLPYYSCTALAASSIAQRGIFGAGQLPDLPAPQLIACTRVLSRLDPACAGPAQRLQQGAGKRRARLVQEGVDEDVEQPAGRVQPGRDAARVAQEEARAADACAAPARRLVGLFARRTVRSGAGQVDTTVLQWVLQCLVQSAGGPSWT